jgi:phosphomevalonate kinase
VLDGQEELDEQRRVIVSDCLAELDALEIEINDECRSYFNRLRELGTLLLITA